MKRIYRIRKSHCKSILSSLTVLLDVHLELCPKGYLQIVKKSSSTSTKYFTKMLTEKYKHDTSKIYKRINCNKNLMVTIYSSCAEDNSL